MYTDPALKENKRWTIYTTHELYKQYKITDATTDYGIMELANEALSLYIELFPQIEEIKKEAQKQNIELKTYLKEILKNRHSS